MYEFDRFAHTNVIAALIFYAMHIAEPSECVRCLEILVPDPKRPWVEIITEVRADWRAINNAAETNLPEVAAQRER